VITMTRMVPVTRHVVPRVRVVVLVPRVRVVVLVPRVRVVVLVARHVVLTVPGHVMAGVSGGRQGMPLVRHLLGIVAAMTVPARRSVRRAVWARAAVMPVLGHVVPGVVGFGGNRVVVAVVVGGAHGVPSARPRTGLGVAGVGQASATV